MANHLAKIDHIVELMLENRSFDQMLGYLYADSKNKSPAGIDFDGLSGEEPIPTIWVVKSRCIRSRQPIRNRT